MRPKNAASIGFDVLMTRVLSMTIGGFFSDLWAHSHGRVETFFTLWHLAIYTAAGAVFVVLAITWARGWRRGSSWRDALPDGYGLSFLGDEADPAHQPSGRLRVVRCPARGLGRAADDRDCQVFLIQA